MAEDTQVITEVEEQETPEQQTEAAKPESIEDLVKSEQAKKTEGAEKESPVDESDKEPDKKAPVKLSAKERIQQLVDEKKSLTETYRTETETLKAEIARIREEQKAGDITKAQASQKIETAEDRFKAVIDGIEISEDLKPYKQDIVRTAGIIAREMINRELGPIKQRLHEEALLKEESELNSFKESLINHYSDNAEKYPDLFSGEKDPQGRPLFKQEIDDLAMKIVAPYDDNGYNRMLATKEGIDHLMQLLSYAVNKSTDLKQRNVLTEKLSRARVETPESRKTSNKPESIEDMVKHEMAKHGG